MSWRCRAETMSQRNLLLYSTRASERHTLRRCTSQTARLYRSDYTSLWPICILHSTVTYSRAD
jgi:hypothetical protein